MHNEESRYLMIELHGDDASDDDSIKRAMATTGGHLRMWRARFTDEAIHEGNYALEDGDRVTINSQSEDQVSASRISSDTTTSTFRLQDGVLVEAVRYAVDGRTEQIPPETAYDQLSRILFSGNMQEGQGR